MPAINDLTWNQLNNALKELVGTNNNLIVLDGYGNPTTLDIGAIVEQFPADTDPVSQQGVVKFMARLFDACRNAQVAANTGQATGERLNAFSAPTSAAPVGTLVPVTRTLVTRADLSSVTKVIGTNV